MNDVRLLAEKSLDLMVQHFELENFNKDIFQISHTNPFDLLVEKLAFVINDFLDYDMSKLLNILYKIDVNEQQLKMILSEEQPENIAYKIAVLVVEREKQKVLTREKYKS